MGDGRTRPIRFLAPLLPPAAEVAAVFAEAERARWFTNEGPCWHRFKTMLEARLGPGLHCVPVASGTAALMVALRALVRRPEATEVLLPSFTFVATASAVLWAGFRPVFVDVERHGWHLDPDRLTEALDARGPHVAAIVACSTFGAPPPPAQSAAWEAAALRHDVPLLVDSAAGFGSVRADGRWLGGQGDAEVFSFHATKPFAIGEGGMVATGDAALAERVRRLSNFGFDAGQLRDGIGLNAKLAEWPAATGVVALRDVDACLAARRASSAALVMPLLEAGFTTQGGAERSARQFVPLLAATREERDRVRAAATTAGVEVRAYYDKPLHQLPALRSCERAGALPVTEDLAARCLSLPMAVDQTDDDRRRIVDVVVGVRAPAGAR